MKKQKSSFQSVKFSEHYIPTKLRVSLNLANILMGLFNFIGMYFFVACINEITKILESNSSTIVCIL